MDRAESTYTETRLHELRKSRLVNLDGNVVTNLSSAEGGTSVRVHDAGYWGFAAVPGSDSAAAAAADASARSNVRAMARFGTRSPLALPGGAYRGEQGAPSGRGSLASGAAIERLAALHAWCRKKYPALRSTQFMLQDEHHLKHVRTSTGSDATSRIDRGMLYVTFVAEDDAGRPVELAERFGVKGGTADLDFASDALDAELDRLHEHLQAKRHSVPARGGSHAVVLGPDLAGILAHEAMGHPCEADLVLGGAVTGSLVGQRVASDLVTMIDVAHTYAGEEVLVPVYADDEGTPARDAVLIDRGILSGFMSSRETAERLGIAPSGSARAYDPGDEPLVRMRNTAIVAGTSTLDAMIAGVDDGYLLLRTANGQADSTTEFMFAITLGYEIRGGKVGRAIRDTTISGSAIKVLQSVDAVSSDMVWSSAGYCGKKQPMVVSMGGPALRARAQLGGE